MKKLLNNSVIAALGFFLVMAISPLANAAGNPFGISDAVQNTHVASTHGEDKCGGEKKAKCGEGKCGDAKKEAKCGEGKCGDAKKESKCGEGKCGHAKKEGKCGEGKCGGAKKEGKCGGAKKDDKSEGESE